MMHSRFHIIKVGWTHLAKALTITIRYSVIRRQFSNVDGSSMERKLLDYQTQMHKIAPLLAYCYAFKAIDLHMSRLLESLKRKVEKKNYSLLGLSHHMSSGFKALVTQKACDGLDVLRQACGGAGFSAWSGLPSLIVDQAPKVTKKGDNIVMATQGTRLIIKAAARTVRRGVKARGHLSYLNKLDQVGTYTCSAKSAESFFNLEILEEALRTRVMSQVKDNLTPIFKSKASNKEIINSLFGIDLLHISEAPLFLRDVCDLQRKYCSIELPSKELISALNLVCALLGIYELSKNNHTLYDCGYFTPSTEDNLTEALNLAYTKIRPLMIPLVEGIGIQDEENLSAIGNKFGDIYETQFEWAKNSRLNQEPVIKGFKENIQPILHGKL
eukprot:CAMPEP_0170566134 /NCGR_PEP_ID=MMETSP0211-20121228/79643_1 /TAXON_ID=311385 /ORGANISM="Pseudokeronopsis sp., Strain OXSARD2" /LENGTH=384 /DNA_ID=CAMNT_0010887223 /DNA_START=830 /DNA_END=1984 /DNA_ORIENTATION=-